MRQFNFQGFFWFEQVAVMDHVRRKKERKKSMNFISHFPLQGGAKGPNKCHKNLKYPILLKVADSDSEFFSGGFRYFWLIT